MGIVIFILYSIWAVYSGLKYVKEKGICQDSVALQFIVGIGIGYLIGAWLLVKGIVLLAIRITDGF